MNTSKQLKSLCDGLVAIYSKPLGMVLGILALPFFITLAITIWTIRLMQIPTDEFDNILAGGHHVAVICVLIIFVATVLGFIKYAVLPFLYQTYWAILFVFNCLAWALSLGTAEWGRLIYIDHHKQSEKVSQA